MSDDYSFAARILRVVDGDTVEVHLYKSKTFTIDWGFKVKTTASTEFQYGMKIRLHGINTPEITGRKAKTEREEGLKAKQFVIDWLDQHCDTDDDGNWLVTLRSHDGDELAPGKYHGRWVAEIWPRGNLDVPSLNEALVTNGHAERLDY